MIQVLANRKWWYFCSKHIVNLFQNPVIYGMCWLPARVNSIDRSCMPSKVVFHCRGSWGKQMSLKLISQNDLSPIHLPHNALCSCLTLLDQLSLDESAASSYFLCISFAKDGGHGYIILCREWEPLWLTKLCWKDNRPQNDTVKLRKTLSNSQLKGERKIVFHNENVCVCVCVCVCVSLWSNWEKLTCLEGKGNGTPLQYSCLDNPMDGGAWWAAVHGVTKSRTWLGGFTFTFHFHALEKEMATHCSVLA